MKEKKRKIKDTKLGVFLREKLPSVLSTVGDLLPEQGALGIVKNLVSKSNSLSAEDQEELDRLVLEGEVEAQRAVSDRWAADMKSDVWLAKVIRPIILISLLSIYTVMAIADSITAVPFEVKDSYTSLLEILMLTSFGAYFAGRTVEKVRK
tara:strand:+ start:1082 stop:1534 length:453 start_codon:yes stop_codon:yes gene_type:complete